MYVAGGTTTLSQLYQLHQEEQEDTHVKNAEPETASRAQEPYIEYQPPLPQKQWGSATKMNA